MSDIYAVILNGVVINTIIANTTSYFDPSFQYAIISGTPTGIGWTTIDNINFLPPTGN